MDGRVPAEQASCCGVNLAFAGLGVVFARRLFGFSRTVTAVPSGTPSRMLRRFESVALEVQTGWRGKICRLVRGTVCRLRDGADHDGDDGLYDFGYDGADDSRHNGGDNWNRDHAGKEH